MVRKLGAVLAGVAVVVICVAGNAADEKKMSIKEVMKAVNGKTGLVAKTEGAVKDGKWEDAQKLSKQLAEAGAALAKNDVPKGDAKSWEKLTKLYADQTTAIDKAATDKDAKALEKAVKAFKGGCKTCHDAHK